MARRYRKTSRRSSRSYSGRRTRARARSSGGRQRIEIVVRQEPTQAIASGAPQMVVDGGRLKMVGDAPKTAKF